MRASFGTGNDREALPFAEVAKAKNTSSEARSWQDPPPNVLRAKGNGRGPQFFFEAPRIMMAPLLAFAFARFAE